MTNQITFKINTFLKDKSVSLSETDLSTLNIELDPMNGIDGVIIITDGDNEIHIIDELWCLAVNACFNTSARLANGESFEFSQYSGLGTVNFVSLGDETIVATEDSSATFKSDLSENLRACGDRIIDFLTKKFSDNSDFSFTIEDVTKARDHSRTLS